MSMGIAADQTAGVPERGLRRHDNEDRDREERTAGERRKVDAFIRCFGILAQKCDGERIDLLTDKGEISALCWELQELQKGYSKLLGEVENQNRVTTIVVHP